MKTIIFMKMRKLKKYNEVRQYKLATLMKTKKVELNCKDKRRNVQLLFPFNNRTIEEEPRNNMSELGKRGQPRGVLIEVFYKKETS